MKISLDFSSAVTAGKVCRLRHSLYGLKQSPQAWFDQFRRAVLEMGYQQSNADHTISFQHNNGKIVILIAYVDDIILTDNDLPEINRLKNHLAQSFEVKDLGPLNYFLGFEIYRDASGFYLNQGKYICGFTKEIQYAIICSSSHSYGSHLSIFC